MKQALRHNDDETQVVLDGTAHVLIDEFIDRDKYEAMHELCRYRITVKSGDEVVHEFTVWADEIELVRL